MTNWKTSLVGFGILVLGVVLLALSKITWEQLLLYIALFGLSSLTKDFNVHGGTVPQATPPAVQAETIKEGKVLECKQDAEKCAEKK